MYNENSDYEEYLGQEFTIRSIYCGYLTKNDFAYFEEYTKENICPYLKNLELVDNMEQIVEQVVDEIVDYKKIIEEKNKEIEKLNKKYDELYANYQYLDGYLNGIEYLIDTFGENIAKHIPTID